MASERVDMGGLGTKPSRLSRRSVLKKGAVVGGTALWVAPAVQIVGMSPASAQSSSPPPASSSTTTSTSTTSTTEAPQCKDISNIQIVVKKNHKYYGLKYDPSESTSWDDWSSAAPNSNDCIRYYEQEYGTRVLAEQWVADKFNESAKVKIINSCEWRLQLPLPDGFTFVQGYVKAGNVASTPCPKAAAPTANYVAFINS
jgi:hypothetical protein